MNELYLFALANLVICIAIGFISICRLNAMKGDVLMRVRTEYAAYIGGALMSAAQPWWGEWPQWGSLSIASVLLLGLACSGHAWRRSAEDMVPEIAIDHPLKKSYSPHARCTCAAPDQPTKKDLGESCIRIGKE